MPKMRDAIVRKVWRGKDPFLTPLAYDGISDPRGLGSPHSYLTDAVEALRPSIIVEVGVWKGASTIRMAARLRELAIDGVVIAVDTWRGAWDQWKQEDPFQELSSLEPSHEIFATFLSNVRATGLEDYIVPLPLDSINAAQILHHLNILPDVVHLDAGHDQAAVASGIRGWWPLLKPGAVLIGDGYRAGGEWPGVKRAFDNYFRPLGLTPIENIDGKCRVSKPQMDRRAANLWGTMTIIGALAGKWRHEHGGAMEALITDDSIDLAEQLRRYVHSDGPDWHHGRIRLMDCITERLRAAGLQGGRDDVFGPDREIRMAAVQAAVPDFAVHYLNATSIDELERFELLPEFENPYARFALPPPLNINMGKIRRPSLLVYRATAVDLFLTPIGFQLFRRREGIYWSAASTRAYPLEAMEHSPIAVDKCVIIVQDIFEGTNFSHFLFDWVPRLGLFLDAGLVGPSDCTFVLGGIPSEFHLHVIQAICEAYSLSENQFLFPAEPEVWHIEGPVYFFSDLKETIMHPAHMAHPRSIAIMRDVCSRIRTASGDIKRIYISRGDTSLRRTANEAELFDHLKPFGFMEVRLASLPFLEQVKLVRGAEIIIAPHGMGLTHIAFHQGLPLILELHNPTIGTDAYACIAHALGFKYHAILGVDTGEDAHHFTVAPREVINMLTQEGIVPESTVAADAPSCIRSRFTGGVQSVTAVEVSEIPPPYPGGIVYKHVRDAMTVQTDNNVGWLETTGLITGAVYHCSCVVWLPSHFNGDRIVIECSNLTSRNMRPTDLTKRDQWQTISINGTAREGPVYFVIRCDADAGAMFYSSEWRTGPGAVVD